MKKRICATFWALCATLAGFSGANAQQQGANRPAGVAEIYVCNFKANKGMNDLHTATDRFNSWADQHNVKDYSAFILTPYVHSDEVTADVLWIGTWPSGAAMGADEATYLSEGADVEAGFDAVVHCPAHEHFAARNVNSPQGPPPESNGVAAFQNCTLKEGHIPPEVFDAAGRWADDLKKHGNDPLLALLFPLAGRGSQESYTFKGIAGFHDAQAYGKFVDTQTTGGNQRANEIFGRLIQCDNPRLYLVSTVRQAAQQP